ncbi:MAG TPA: YebC/PmpR family DNA-binding transcriptional regulator [Candidatus Saccharimonadales bacterium]|jgi:YebC/PmpR family DNA-binding regulatory protein
MSGHSKWATIKRQKGANDAKRGQLFTKLGNAISIAAKNGGDPAMNASLAMAIEKAKSANMPNANIERAVKRGTGELGGEQIVEYLFEGYGPNGIGVIVEAASDNRNRTTADVRSAFVKNGGNLAETGAVAFQFTRKGLIRLAENSEETALQAIEAGAEDVVESGDELMVYTAMQDLASVREKLKAGGHEIKEAGLIYDPNNLIEIEDSAALSKTEKLIESLEDLDDVTATYANFDVSEDLGGG